MKISVIIPVYNAERYLEACLDSVMAQYFQDWECLLVNDGSTDLSGKICDRYSGIDTRFMAFHIGNSGVSVARNMGIKHARGEYVAFIDSDDTVERGYLMELYEKITANRADLAVCGVRRVYPEGAEVVCATEGVVSLGCGNFDGFVELTRKSLLYGACMKLYRSEIIKEKNIAFPVGVDFGEDLMFNFAYLEYASVLAVSEAPNYNYRIASGGTLSTSASSREFWLNYEQWKVIRSFFGRKGIDTPDARKCLSDRLWGLAYDTAMSRRLPLGKIRKIFCRRFVKDLLDFSSCSIAVPGWLRMCILKRQHLLIWLLQRRITESGLKTQSVKP